MRLTPKPAADATAGAIATVAMSGVMVLGDRAGLMGEQPPTLVSMHTLRQLGVADHRRQGQLLAPLAHLGFGAAGGTLFGLSRRLVPDVPRYLHGVLFGLSVWAVSYKGWIPALGILPPPERDRAGRPVAMVAAHIVYGLVLARLVQVPGPPRDDR